MMKISRWVKPSRWVKISCLHNTISVSFWPSIDRRLPTNPDSESSTTPATRNMAIHIAAAARWLLFVIAFCHFLLVSCLRSLSRCARVPLHRMADMHANAASARTRCHAPCLSTAHNRSPSKMCRTRSAVPVCRAAIGSSNGAAMAREKKNSSRCPSAECCVCHVVVGTECHRQRSD